MSIRSMTGFGRGSARIGGFAAEVELSSVNKKQLDLVLGIPKQHQVLDARIQEEIRQKLGRGRVTCSVSLDVSSANSGQRKRGLEVNRALAENYLLELKQLSEDLDIPLNLDAKDLVRLPEVFVLVEQEADCEACWPAIRRALRAALRDLLVMREEEGAILLKDLAKRLATLKRLLRAIEKRAAGSTARYRQNLIERLEKAGLQIALDDERLLKEIALFAEKSDFTEEVIRLDSHVEQFESKLTKNQPVGRALDFLCQEIFREISTLGVKAHDSEISHKVVAFKSELEKLREQVQNVE